MCLATPCSTKTIVFSFFSSLTHWNMFWQPSPKIWCSSVTIKELYPALGDAPSFTHFSPEIDRNYENESPETFQTFSFGTDVSQISAVRFAEENGKKYNAGTKCPISWFSEQFWPLALRVYIWQRHHRRQKKCFSLFFFFNPVYDIFTVISQNLVFLAHD